MNATTTSTHPNTTIPFPPPPPADSTEPAGTRRGRPSGCTDWVVARMKGYIRKHGFSDTAAAEAVGVSSSSISRWKQQDPELASELRVARSECRIRHLEIIEKAAEQENGRGWRASAWILERLWPQDYSPKMNERYEHERMEGVRRRDEEKALAEEDRQAGVAERHATNARKAKEWDEFQKAAAALEATMAAGAPASVDDSRNSRNAAPDAQPHPQQAAAVQSSAGAEADPACSHSAGNSQNSRNAGGAEDGSLADALFAALAGDSQNSRNSDSCGLPAAAGAPLEEARVPSVRGSHNSRKSSPGDEWAARALKGLSIF